MINIPPHHVGEAIGALTGIVGHKLANVKCFWMSLANVKPMGLYRYVCEYISPAARNTYRQTDQLWGATVRRLGNFDMNDVGWRPQPLSSMRYTE